VAIERGDRPTADPGAIGIVLGADRVDVSGLLSALRRTARGSAEGIRIMIDAIGLGTLQLLRVHPIAMIGSLIVINVAILRHNYRAMRQWQKEN
jgi:hypothetical protein